MRDNVRTMFITGIAFEEDHVEGVYYRLLRHALSRLQCCLHMCYATLHDKTERFMAFIPPYTCATRDDRFNQTGFALNK